MMTRERLRTLLLQSDTDPVVEDAYSAEHIDDPDDMMSAAEHGFMRGYTS